MKKLLVLVVFFSLLLFACKDDSVTSGKFWAQNLSSSEFYKVDAQLLAENNLCYVWAEKGSGVTEAIAQNVADAYKNDIYNKMLTTFGYLLEFQDEKAKLKVLDTIQFANWLAKGKDYDGKLTILLLDIKDDYQRDVNDSFVAGYFWAGNLYENSSPMLQGQPSNECDMIYVDTNPGIPGSKESNTTLAHELQHLMNFVGSFAIRGKLTDLWVDEGLSVTAEWMYSNEHSAQRLYCYNKDISGLLAKGNNFFVWGNRKENQYAVLDDYSTVYLFFQWLRLQSGDGVYKKISVSKKNDYNAVIDAFNDTVSNNKYSDWESMLKDWLAANYFKSSANRYGYRSDTVLNNIKIHYAPNGSTNISLFPGEGVNSNVTSSTSIPAATGNINYAGLTGSAPIPSGSFSSGALLTYNANTDIGGAQESGTITGVAPPSASIVSVPSGGRGIGFGVGPFPISAGDMLRRKGKKDVFYSGSENFKIPDTYKGIIVNE